MSRTTKFHILSIFILALAVHTPNGWAVNWDQIKKATEAIRTISADFIQEKHLKILSRPLVSKGLFFYQAPNSLRWEYTAPVRSILLMRKGRIKRYLETSEGLIEESRGSLQGVQIILHEITMWLRGSFDDDPNFDAILQGRGKIVLTPKEKSLSGIIERVDLTLSDRPGIMESVTIYESEDSYTKIRFINIRINKEINEALFTGTL